MRLVLVLMLALQDDPQKHLDDIVRRLGSDEITERNKAQEELGQFSKQASEKTLEALKARLKQARDPEVKVRLKSVIDPIEAKIKWLNLWTVKPVDLADLYVKKMTCPACKKSAPWDVSELKKDDILTKYVTDCRFFLLAWKCCQDKPVPPKVLCVVKKTDTYFEIEPSGEWKSNLRDYLKPAASQEEALLIGAIIVALWDFKASFGKEVDRLVKGGHVTEKVKGFFVATYASGDPKNNWRVDFDSEGRFSHASFESGMRVRSVK